MPSAPKPSGSATRAATRVKARPLDRREQRRRQHHDLSRAQLLDAAEEVFGAKGFHDTTLKEIADRAGFSVGSVYSFFESKDDLFVSVFLRRGAEFMAELEALATSGADPVATLHAAVDFEVGFFREHPHFGRLYLRTANAVSPLADAESDLARQLASNFTRAMELQAELFRAGQAAGELRAGDPLVLSRLFSGLMTAYHAVDPAVVCDDEHTERLALADLHVIVDDAFRRRH